MDPVARGRARPLELSRSGGKCTVQKGLPRERGAFDARVRAGREDCCAAAWARHNCTRISELEVRGPVLNLVSIKQGVQLPGPTGTTKAFHINTIFVEKPCPSTSVLVTLFKFGTIQRRLAWPLRKDDTFNRERLQNTFLFFWFSVCGARG